jgi:hypothetical protein
MDDAVGTPAFTLPAAKLAQAFQPGPNLCGRMFYAFW